MNVWKNTRLHLKKRKRIWPSNILYTYISILINSIYSNFNRISVPYHLVCETQVAKIPSAFSVVTIFPKRSYQSKCTNHPSPKRNCINFDLRLRLPSRRWQMAGRNVPKAPPFEAHSKHSQRRPTVQKKRKLFYSLRRLNFIVKSKRK